MNILRFLEVAVFVFIDFIPNLLLAVYSFRKFLRYSKGITLSTIAVLYFLLIISRILGTYSVKAATVMSVLWIIIYLLFYRINLMLELKKLLFILLIILNYGSFVIIVYSYLGFKMLSGVTDRPYSIQSSGILAIIMLLSYPAILWLMEKKVKPLVVSQINNKIWNFLWMVPATFCLSYYYNLYVNGGVRKYSEHLNNVVFAVIFNLGSLFVIYLITCLVKESNESMQLKEENYMLSMQSVQYENLQNRMEETRKTRHDIRQILNVISSCLHDNEISRLKEYLSQYTNSLPPDTPIVYCEDYVLNALLVYYADQAAEYGILFQAEVNYAGNTNISDSDVSILFGNLLENSLDACRKQEHAKPFITVKVQKIQEAVVITIDNSYGNTIIKTGDTFRSSKGKRIGIGISSIIRITEKYNGMAKFEYDDLVFHASVVLHNNMG